MSSRPLARFSFCVSVNETGPLQRPPGLPDEYFFIQCDEGEEIIAEHFRTWERIRWDGHYRVVCNQETPMTNRGIRLRAQDWMCGMSAGGQRSRCYSAGS
jgi:hypothetical protein